MYDIPIEDSSILPIANNAPVCKTETTLVLSELVTLNFFLFFKGLWFPNKIRNCCHKFDVIQILNLLAISYLR